MGIFFALVLLLNFEKIRTRILYAHSTSLAHTY
jgi:hypothetical protein